MTRRLLDVLVALAVLPCAPLAGCARAYTTFDVFDRHPKFVGLRPLLHADAEKWLAGGASRVNYCISVEPHADAGLTMSIGTEGRDNYSHTFYCSTRTIGRANTATCVMVARYPDGRMETEDKMYFWEGGRWLTYFQWLERHHPKEWKAFQLIEQTIQEQRLARKVPATAPSPVPATRPR